MKQYLIDDSMFEFDSEIPDYTDYSWLLQNPFPPGARVLTREQVEKVIGNHINLTQGLLWALDELFGEKSA